MSSKIKPENDEDKIIEAVASCMVLDQFGHWFDKDAARKVLEPLFSDSRQHDLWAAQIRIAEANTRKAMDEQQATNAALQYAVRQKNHLESLLYTLNAKATHET